MFWFSRGDSCFLDRARGREFCRPSLLPSCKFFGKTYGIKRSISNFELSADNVVAIVNTYGSTFGDNKDHVDDSTTEVC